MDVGQSSNLMIYSLSAGSRRGCVIKTILSLSLVLKRAELILTLVGPQTDRKPPKCGQSGRCSEIIMKELANRLIHLQFYIFWYKELCCPTMFHHICQVQLMSDLRVYTAKLSLNCKDNSIYHFFFVCNICKM